jgi:hypothetical protein
MMVFAVLLGQAGKYMSPPQPVYWPLVQWLACGIGIAFYGFLAFFIYRAVKYFGIAGKEQKLLRMETGKLAEEVHLLRQELKDSRSTNSPAQVG